RRNASFPSLRPFDEFSDTAKTLQSRRCIEAGNPECRLTGPRRCGKIDAGDGSCVPVLFSCRNRVYGAVSARSVTRCDVENSWGGFCLARGPAVGTLAEGTLSPRTGPLGDLRSLLVRRAASLAKEKHIFAATSAMVPRPFLPASRHRGVARRAGRSPFRSQGRA